MTDPKKKAEEEEEMVDITATTATTSSSSSSHDDDQRQTKRLKYGTGDNDNGVDNKTTITTTEQQHGTILRNSTIFHDCSFFFPNEKEEQQQQIQQGTVLTMTKDPYMIGMIDHIFNNDFLNQISKEVKQHTKVTYKESDLFKVYQSFDMANLDLFNVVTENNNNENETTTVATTPTTIDWTTLLPTVLQLRNVLYSIEFRKYIESCCQLPPNTLVNNASDPSQPSVSITDSNTNTSSNNNTTNNKKDEDIQMDCAFNCHVQGCHLLCHDDVIKTRKVSYILYLTDPDDSSSWSIPSDGGCLELYNSYIEKDNDDTTNQQQPGQPVPYPIPCKIIQPLWNRLVFFVVEPGQSFHSVQEVYNPLKPRLSLQGWYHTTTTSTTNTTATATTTATTNTTTSTHDETFSTTHPPSEKEQVQQQQPQPQQRKYQSTLEQLKAIPPPPPMLDQESNIQDNDTDPSILLDGFQPFQDDHKQEIPTEKKMMTTTTTTTTDLLQKQQQQEQQQLLLLSYTTLLSPVEITYLLQYMNPTYLTEKAIGTIRKQFTKESSIQLRHFLRNNSTSTSSNTDTNTQQTPDPKTTNNNGIDATELQRYMEQAEQERLQTLSSLSTSINDRTNNSKNNNPDEQEQQQQSVEQEYIQTYYNVGVTDHWKMIGPAHKQRYLQYNKNNANTYANSTSNENDNKSNVNDVVGTYLHRIQKELFQSSIFAKYLHIITKLDYEPIGYQGMIRHFRPGVDYTVAHYGLLLKYPTVSVLDTTLCFVQSSDSSNSNSTSTDEQNTSNTPNKSKEMDLNKNNASADKGGGGVNDDNDDDDENINENEMIWQSGDCGGFECYIAAEDDEDGENGGPDDEYNVDNDGIGDDNDDNNNNNNDNELLSVHPSFNTLSIVYRNPGTMRFIKYLSQSAPSSRWDIAMEYQVPPNNDDDDDEEEDEDDNDDDDNESNN